ncbi:MAG: inositol monophosphatase family protein [Pseudomonadota bacterium]
MDALDIAVAHAMRDAAHRAIMPRFTAGQPIAADFKSAGEAVTAADRESEAILAEWLAPLIPGAGIVGEEAAHHDPGLLSALAQGTCWIIDPLDGTGNFAKGLEPFGMLVALADGGVPVAGWLLDPLSGRFCSAQAGKGAMVDGARFTVPADANERLIVAVTRLFADQARRAALLESLGRTCDVVDSPRCAADQYPRVATGEHDATLFTRTIAWDHAAGVVFLNEAGGRARRQDGSGYRCDDADAGLIIASSAARWDYVADALEQSGMVLGRAHLSDA